MYKKIAIGFVASIFFIVANCYADSFSMQNSFIISPDLQTKIKDSPFNLLIKGHNGKKFKAYLYAEDGHSENWKQTHCLNGDEYETRVKIGHFYLYLYDLQTKKFLPIRKHVFPDFRRAVMNMEGANFFLWSSTGKNKKDIIFLSQLVACSVGNQYEAYGLSEDESHLERYNFVDDELLDIFSGRIYLSKKEGNHVISPNLHGYTVLEKGIVQYKFTLSDKPREIKQVDN